MLGQKLVGQAHDCSAEEDCSCAIAFERAAAAPLDEGGGVKGNRNTGAEKGFCLGDFHRK
jgi:hypothetical protein